MERRNFFKILGISLVSIAVVPSETIKSVVNDITPDMDLIGIWRTELMKAELTLRQQINDFFLYGIAVTDEKGNRVDPVLTNRRLSPETINQIVSKIANK